MTRLGVSSAPQPRKASRMASKPKLTLPPHVDENVLRRAHAATRSKQRRQFKQAVARERLVNSLKKQYLPKPARRPQPAVFKAELAAARAVLGKMRPRRPIYAYTPIVSPVGSLYPPYNNPFENDSRQGTILTRPVAGTIASGQLGSSIGAWGSGSASVQKGVYDFYFLPKGGTYALVANLKVGGVYYVSGPAYGIASVSLNLAVWADDVNYDPNYQPTSNTVIETASTDFFAGGRDWDFIDKQTSAVCTFPAGDAPTYYAIGVTLTAQVTATTGCIASIEAAATLESISIALLS